MKCFKPNEIFNTLLLPNEIFNTFISHRDMYILCVELNISEWSNIGSIANSHKIKNWCELLFYVLKIELSSMWDFKQFL